MGKALGLTQKAYVGLEIGWGRLYVGLEMEDEGSRERGLIPEVLGLGLWIEMGLDGGFWLGLEEGFGLGFPRAIACERLSFQ